MGWWGGIICMGWWGELFAWGGGGELFAWDGGGIICMGWWGELFAWMVGGGGKTLWIPEKGTLAKIWCLVCSLCVGSSNWS